MKLLAVGLIVLLAAAIAYGAPPDSVWIEGAPLQVKLDRLYLGCGLEDRIYPNCRFVVHRGYDSIFTGCIETSYPGVSASFPTDHFFDTLRLSNLHVWVERAPIDTTTPVVLGHFGFLPVLDRTQSDSMAHSVSIVEYKTQFEMSLAFEQRAIDGFFSYRRYGPGGDLTTTIARPAPFFVALIPNPSKAITQKGFLTTSLYYRLDPQRLPMYFDGDAILPFNRPGIDGDTVSRSYPYAPADGRRLLENLPAKTRDVTISIEHPMLRSTAGYFADILSRDQFRTTVVAGTEEADLRLVIIPLGDNDVATLGYLYTLLAADTVVGMASNQTLRIIGGYIDAAEADSDPSVRLRYVQLAESSLRDDLGVFPLFRPTLFFTARQSLLGDVFAPNGCIRSNSLTKIRLPIGREDCGQ